MIFILSGHTHDYNEPYITEEIFFSSMWYHEDFTLEFMLMENLKKHEVLDESSFKMVASLRPPRVVMDRLHYVMYRIGKKENGLQIFYQCLKETQDRAPRHRYAVEILKMEGEFRAWNKERFSYFVIAYSLVLSFQRYIYVCRRVHCELPSQECINH